MFSPESVCELQASWIPNLTDAGMDRWIELLESNSPLLIHGSFTRSLPMGCLATHAAWHHPRTQHLTIDAGINWLHRVAGLNPATSRVLRDWDSSCRQDFETRSQLLQLLHDARARRRGEPTEPRLAPTPAELPACVRNSAICNPQSAVE
jgi:hypothetical protein